MKSLRIAGKISFLCLPMFLGIVLVGCRLFDQGTMQERLKECDEDVQTALSVPTGPKWKLAYGKMMQVTLECETPFDQQELEHWKQMWRVRLQHDYMATILPEIRNVKKAWDSAILTEGGVNVSPGDASRKALLERMKNELPEDLAEKCVRLSDMRMGSDRNLTRMRAAYTGLLKRVERADVNGGGAVVKQLDDVLVGWKKIGEWHRKIDDFMAELSKPDVFEWAGMRPATYKTECIVPMEKIRDEVWRRCHTKRWEVQVNARRNDYRNVKVFSQEGRYQEAMKILAAHDLILKPEGFPGCVEFDDSLERTKVANGALGQQIVGNLMLNGLSGVQYCRRYRRGIYSMLVFGSAPIEERKNRRQAIRKAFKVAKINAALGYSEFMETYIESVSQSDVELKNDESFEQFKNHLREVTKATMNNMMQIARCVNGEEVVVVLGWRDPEAGNLLVGEVLDSVKIREVPMEISPSIGAFL